MTDLCSLYTSQLPGWVPSDVLVWMLVVMVILQQYLLVTGDPWRGLLWGPPMFVAIEEDEIDE